ncbi:MAG: response regulator [Planctomycetia bacterium]|nr:response regulator [Planctomycetia bacterium]
MIESSRGRERELRPVCVLLVEDSPSDARLMLEALKEGQSQVTVQHVSDGEMALAYLRRQGDYAQAERPDLIFLDLNLPRRSGLEVLSEIKQDEGLRSIPVVVLTTSSDTHDVRESYQLSASCYVTKPVDLEEFVEAVRTIDHFFFSVATLPPHG